MSLLNCVFFILFGVVFAVLLVIESQLIAIKAMMEEHTRYDEPLKNGASKHDRYNHKE